MTRLSIRRRIAFLGLLAAALALLLVVYWRLTPAAVLPVRFIQIPGEIDHVEFSQDGRLLLMTDAQDRLITFRDAATGQIVHQWRGGAGRVWLSADGTRLLEAEPAFFDPPFLDGPTHCTLCDAATGRALRHWTGQILDVLPDFSLMVTADDFRYSHTPSSNETPLHNPRNIISPTEGQVVEVATGRVAGRFTLSQAYGARLSRDGHFLCLPDEKNASRLLRVPEMTPLLPLPLLSSLNVSQGGAQAFGISPDGTLHFWSLSTGQHTAVASGLTRAFWASERNGTILVSGVIGTAQNQRSVMQIRSADGTRLLSSQSNSFDAYSENGRFAAMHDWGHASSPYDVTNLQTRQRTARLDMGTDPLGQPVSGSMMGQNRLAIAPDGRHFACVTPGGLLRLYDLNAPRPQLPRSSISTDSGRTVLDLNKSGESGFEGRVRNAAVLPGGGVAVSTAPSDGISRQIFTADQAVAGHHYQVAQFQASPDGKTLAVLWNGVKPTMEGGKPINEATENGMMELRDARTGHLLRTLLASHSDSSRGNAFGALGKPAFSPDGTLLGVADDEGRILLFDTASGRKIGQMSGAHVLSVGRSLEFSSDMFGNAATLAFAPGNQWLAAGRDDGAIYLYSLKTLLPAAQIGKAEVQAGIGGNQIASPPRWLAFDARGGTLYGIACNGSVVLAWDIPKSL